MTVLVVSEAGDLHAAAVAAVLRRDHGITAAHLDMRDFPATTASYHAGAAGTARAFGPVALDGVRTVWWRRPRAASVPRGLNQEDDEFRRSECDHFLQGLLWSTPATWVNDPGAERVAARKLVQLDLAARAGLTIPETLVTNDPREAARFAAAQRGPVVFKRTGTGPGQFCETRMLTAEALTRLASIRLAPTTFQEYVDAVADIRVVWIAGREWSVRIDSQAGIGTVDSRLDNSVAFTPCELPADVSAGLARLMGALGLVFGVVDLREARDGRTYFLEVNPQGQFAYLEIKTGLPVVADLAALLAEPEARLRRTAHTCDVSEIPPSTGITAPVTYAPARLAR